MRTSVMSKYGDSPLQPPGQSPELGIETNGDYGVRGSWLHDLASSYGDAGDTLLARGYFAKASEKYQATLSLFERLAAIDPQDPKAQIDLANSHACIGDVCTAQ